MRNQTVTSLVFMSLAGALEGSAQFRVNGQVVDGQSRSPIGGAVVTSLPKRQSTSTDRSGRFRLLVTEGDTLLVAAVGFQPDSVIVSTGSLAGVFRIELAPSAMPLADIIVSAEGHESLAWTEGHWRLPAATARSLPFAVEPDVYRSLALVPAVSFSTILSARPLIRGYDAGHTSLKIDGIETAHPYHIGRAFSAFPLDATEQVSVITAPGEPGREGGISGDVDIQGRNGPTAASRGGADFTLGSASAWYGRGRENPVFGAVRLATLSIANQAVPDEIFPYWFVDYYGTISRGDKARGSVFLSRDELGDRGRGTGVEWWTLLGGARLEAVRSKNAALDVTLSGTRYGLDITRFQTERGVIDAENRFSRATAGLDLTATALSVDWALGATLGYREVVNEETTGPGETALLDIGRTESAVHLQASRSFGPVGASAGARLEQAGEVHVVQPRIRLGARLTPNLKVSLGAGRASRLFHLLSSPSAQPDLEFLEYWLPAGEGGNPVPRVDHVVLELEAQRGSALGRLSAYTSRGRGVGEGCDVKQPINCDEAYRFGRSRTSGVEVQVAIRGTETRDHALSLSYALALSDRNFGAGWSRWTLDRRHIFRVFGQFRPTSRWSVGASLEAASGMPFTPVEQIVLVGGPGASEFPGMALIFGRENSAPTAGTMRLDIASRWQMRGPWRTRLTFAASVTNLAFGPVAPIELDEIYLPEIRYKRSFTLPAIPTFTFRFEF